MRIDKPKAIKIVYFVVSIVLAALLTLLLSNLYWIQQRLGNTEKFFYGPFQPYENTQDQQRFAINDLNHTMSHMMLSISAVNKDYTAEVHYQLPGDTSFYSASLSLRESDAPWARPLYIAAKRSLEPNSPWPMAFPCSPAGA